MTGGWRIIFDPVLPVYVLAAAGLILIAAAIFAARVGLRGQVLRLMVGAIVLAILLRPALIMDHRTALNDIAAIVVDQTQSQQLRDRPAQTQAALEQVQSKLRALDHLDTRVITIPQGSNEGTELFTPLARALSDVPNERLAGVILITDGQVHDTPADPARSGLNLPVHVLLTGQARETDRRLIVEQAPKFAILGEVAEIGIKVEDDASPPGTQVMVDLAIDGAPQIPQRVTIGKSTKLQVVLSHGGQNLVEIAVPPGDQYLTLDNKRALVPIKGIRDRLRVLLVSGEPHPGERTWRNLLKADPSVDLVHFTILRPPEKQDGTPINELALIAFPTRELFVEKLSSFDLIIFDRYHWRSILPAAYFDNIARYVENGGSLLVALDPSFAGGQSLYRTPLAAVLPARPTGDIFEGPFRPQMTELGRKHPVTADLIGAGPVDGEPSWGHWFRAMGSQALSGETVMTAPGGRPLLQLAHIGQGRVAQLLSDEVWLWARGYDGGGPQAELLRRISHWLMREPELEEETLKASAFDGRIEIERRTLAPAANRVTITPPDSSGKPQQTIDLSQSAPGRWTATIPADALGLYRLNDGALQALTIAGPPNSLEMADVRSTETKLRPIADATGGGVFRLAAGGVPSFRHISAGQSAHGAGWAGLRANDQASVTEVSGMPLADPRWLLVPLLGLLLMAWWREGR